MTADHGVLVSSLLRSLETSRFVAKPYPHWFLAQCLPERVVDELLQLPFEVADIGPESGKRDLHNDSRHYFDVKHRKAIPTCDTVCRALQDPRVTDGMSDRFAVDLRGSYLRVEYAQDSDGFWLEPHTDLGVKALTVLLYLSRDPQHATLGTDIYDASKKHVGTSPFASNAAMAFVPGTATFHGFERRTIKGVRKSMIVNFVTNEWRAREQLAFPDSPVGSS
jgi:hypothetical protein